MKFNWNPPGWKRLLFKISPFPRPLIGEIYHHLQMLRLRLRSRFNPIARWRQNRYRGQTGLRLNIGCGAAPLDGWVNIDGWYSDGVDLQIDCRHHLPFDSGSVKMIFCEHVFEHFHRPFETDPFLRECHRVLEPGGIVRIIVPDFRCFLEKYLEKDPCPPVGQVIVFEDENDLLVEKPSVPETTLEFETRMEALNAISHSWWHHKYIYDGPTLAQCFFDAGFGEAQIQSYGVSLLPELAVDSPARQNTSVYVEGIRGAEVASLP